MKYHVKGTITYTVRVWVDEEIEGDDPDSVLEALTNDCAPDAPGFLDTVEYDDDNLQISEVDDDPLPEDVRMRQIGAVTLPGF